MAQKNQMMQLAHFGVLGTITVCAGIIMVLMISIVTFQNTVSMDVHSLAPASELGILADRNFQVVQVIPGGAAEKAGVHIGDVVKSVGGTEIFLRKDATRIVQQKIDDFNKSIQQTNTSNLNTAIAVEITRNNQSINFRCKPTSRPTRPNAPTPTVPPYDYIYL